MSYICHIDDIYVILHLQVQRANTDMQSLAKIFFIFCFFPVCSHLHMQCALWKFSAGCMLVRGRRNPESS